MREIEKERQEMGEKWEKGREDKGMEDESES